MKHVYFAGGGTGGHIYPALAIAEEIICAEPDCEITFFCSDRLIDTRILSKTDYRFIRLKVSGFSKNPYRAMKFCKNLVSAKKTVSQTMALDGVEKSVLLSVGGFVSAAPVFAAKKLNIPIAMLNIDAVPGKANKLMARWAKDIFVQFDNTAEKFGTNRNKVLSTGCPLRADFFKSSPNNVVKALGLNPNKKILLITGASGGAANINNVIGYMLDRIGAFANEWQVVHLAGIVHYDSVRAIYQNAKIKNVVLDYFDDMAGLLAAAHLVIGRAGAMSVAEFAGSNTPAICLPYPYHGDKHQRLNARYLLDAGCGAIVDDLCDVEKTAKLLWPVMAEFMASPEKLAKAAQNCQKIVRPNAAKIIAEKILSY